jgi:hypothetical protein
MVGTGNVIRIYYKCEENKSSMTINKRLHCLIGASVGDANKWCREQARDICAAGNPSKGISRSVSNRGIILVADPKLIKKAQKIEKEEAKG